MPSSIQRQDGVDEGARIERPQVDRGFSYADKANWDFQLAGNRKQHAAADSETPPVPMSGRILLTKVR